MEKSLVCILSTTIWLFAQGADAQPRQSELYVFAPTLNVQTSPGAGHKIVGTLTYGDSVQVSADSTADERAWVNISTDTETGRVQGYARMGALLSLPAPDITMTGFSSLTRQLTPSVEPSGTKTDDTLTVTQSYGHGVTLITRTFYTPYGEFSDQQISVSGLTVAQGFLLARAIVNQDGATSDHMTRDRKSVV